MKRDKQTDKGEARGANRDEPARENAADVREESPAEPRDHDVPNEEVIEKTLPKPNSDNDPSQ